MVLTDAGEDDIFYCPSCEFCVNQEIAEVSAGDDCPHCQQAQLKKARASEVGNVFDLGSKYTKDFDLTYMDESGEHHHPIMGCYGWGTTRTMGVIVEKFNDEHGIIWPKAVSPFDAYLINIGLENKQTKQLYDKLQKAGYSILWDDRDESPGTKFADADLIGIPHRLVISEKTEGKIECKHRTEDKVELLTFEQVLMQLR
jgi:prolyl-tRNA synthetase